MLRKLLVNLEGEGTGAGTSGAGAAAAGGKDTGTPAGGTGGGKDTPPGGKEESITDEPENQESVIDDPEGKGGEKGKGKAKADPSSADLKLKLPEGMDVKEADPYVAVFKKHGLKPEAAQEIFDMALKASGDARGALEEEIMSMAAKTRQEWLDSAKKDKEIGGDKFNESVSLANRFVRAVGGEKLMAILKSSGLGKHPEVIRAFAKAGRSISEDSIGGTTGGRKGGEVVSKKDQLRRDFPNSPGMWQHLPD